MYIIHLHVTKQLILKFLFCYLQVAFDKLFRFATSHVFATDSAGRMCAEMCGTACRVDPSITLKRFVPHIASRISEILEGDEYMNNE